MADNLFRTRSEPSISPEAMAEKLTPEKRKEDVPLTGDVTEEPIFTDYKQYHHHPYLVDHFNLGDTWRDKLGGFEKEIELIEGYFKNKIEQGQLQNDTNVVKDQIKKIYKLCDIDKGERVTMQIEKLAAYIEFLKKTDQSMFNHYKYG